MISGQTCQDDDRRPNGVYEDHTALLAEAVEAMGFGIMLVSDDGSITFANATARELIRQGDGLRANGGWIGAASTTVTARLRAYVKASAKAAEGRRGSGATIIAERGGKQSSLFVHVMPLDRGKAATRAAAAAIFIIDPEAQAMASFGAFAALYGLTRAETRVLREIVAGQGLVAAAGRLRISEATARTHLQHIFDKTGAKRQTELLCLFFKATLPVQIGRE